MIRWVLVAIALLVGGGAASRADDTGQREDFELTISGTMEVDTGNHVSKIGTDIHLKYRWTSTAKQRILRLESMTTVVTNDGRRLIDYAIDRNAMIRRKDGQEQTIRLEDMPAETQEQVTDTFGKPIAMIDRRDDGSEGEPKIVMTDTAKKFLTTDELAWNVIFFHPAPPPVGEEWRAVRTLVSARAGPISGELTYRRTEEKGERRTYSIGGHLTPTEDDKKDVMTFKIIEGKQTFDTKNRLWTSGEFTADLAGQARGARVKGRMTYRVEPIKS